MPFQRYGGLEGHIEFPLPDQEDRIIASLADYRQSCADKIYASAQVQGLVAAYTLVSSLYRCVADKHSSIDFDVACGDQIKELIAIDPSSGPVQTSLQRLSYCCAGHSMMLRADEMMARLLMECRRMFRESIRLHQAIIRHIQTYTEERGPLAHLQNMGPAMHPEIGESLRDLLLPECGLQGQQEQHVPACLVLPRAVSRAGDVLLDAAVDLSAYTDIHVVVSDFAVLSQLPMLPEVSMQSQYTTIGVQHIKSFFTANGIILNPDARQLNEYIGESDGRSFI